jgi:uncharacterized protein
VWAASVARRVAARRRCHTGAVAGIRRSVPKLLAAVSNGEHPPAPRSDVVREAERRLADVVDEVARRHRVDRRTFLRSSAGAAATLVVLAACTDEQHRASTTTSTAGSSETTAPLGTFAVPPSAVTDPEQATSTLAPFDGEVVVDVQTHFLDPDELGFGAGFPQAACDDDASRCFTIDRWADLVLGSSDTSIAVLSAIPVVDDPNPMSIEKMAEARRLADVLCGDGRVLLQGEAFPHVGDLAAALDGMSELAAAYPIAAWKTYTHIGSGYSLTDAVGEAFLGRVSELAAAGIGPPVVCVHKGFGADPADVGPAARAHPDLTFCVYHSGFEPGGPAEGPYAEHGAGVDRLVTSLRGAGIGPGSNVYAELGSTWFSVLRDPDAATHVLGKLLSAFGAERILWGTDSIWYGSPQDQIQAFRTFTIGEEAQERFGYPELTEATKRAILGANAAALHGIDLASVAAPCRFTAEERDAAREEALGRLGPLADVALGPTTAAAAQRAFRAAHPWFS